MTDRPDERLILAELRRLDGTAEPEPDVADAIFRRVMGERSDHGSITVLPTPGESRRPTGSAGDRRWLAASVGFAAVLLVGVLTWLAVPPRGGDPDVASDTSPATETTSVDDPGAEADPATFPPGSIGLPDGLEPVTATWGADRFWVVATRVDVAGLGAADSPVILALDTDGVVQSETPIDFRPRDIVADDAGVWVSGGSGGQLTRIDPATGEVTGVTAIVGPDDIGTVRFAGRPIVGDRLALANGSVWVFASLGAVVQVDVATGDVVALHVMQQAAELALVEGEGTLWVAPATPSAPLVVVDTSTGTVTSGPIGGLEHRAMSGLADGSDLYLAGDEQVSRVDLGSVEVVDIGGLGSPAAIFARTAGRIGLLVPTGFIPVSDAPGVVGSPLPIEHGGLETFDVEGETWLVTDVLEPLRVGEISTERDPGETTFLPVPDGAVATAAVATTGDDGRFWVIAATEQVTGGPPAEQAEIISIDPVTRQVATSTSLAGAPSLIVASDDAVWVAQWATGDLTRIDPETGEVVATVHPDLPFDVGSGADRRDFIPSGLIVADGDVWLLTARGALAQIDATTNEIAAIHDLEGTVPSSFAVGDETVFVTTTAGPDVVAIERADGGQRTVVDDLGHVAQLSRLEGRYLYVTGGSPDPGAGSDFRVSEIDTTAGDVTAITEIGSPVVAIGNVQGAFVAVDAIGQIHALGDTLLLVDPLLSDLLGSVTTFEVDGDLWRIVPGGTELRQVVITGPAPDVLPIDIPEQFDVRPVSPADALSPDWERLYGGPLSERWVKISVWTGEEVLFWGGEPVGGGVLASGGAAYDPISDTWREMSGWPFGPGLDEPVSGVWTGTELVVWTQRGAAAWDPGTNGWRVVEDWSLRPSYLPRAVWTGTEIIDVDAALAVDPGDGSARAIAGAPPIHDRASVVWAEGEVVVVPGSSVYDVATDSWRQTGPSGLTSLAADGAWTGNEVVAVDYEMRASAYVPATGEWDLYPAVPLRFFECHPEVLAVGAVPYAVLCSGDAVWVGSQWVPLGKPTTGNGFAYVAADGTTYAWGDGGLFRLRSDRLSGPSARRLSVGTSLLDLPDGWAVGDVVAGGPGDENGTYNTVRLTGSGIGLCRVVATHADAESVLRRALAGATGPVEFSYEVGGEPVEALEVPPGADDDLHHLVWATGTTDVVDVGCTTPEATMLIARNTWSPWQ